MNAMDTPMPTDAALKIINHAANQSDRWIFVALLAIGIFAAYMLFRHFTAREQALEAKIDRIGTESKEQNQQFISYLQTANRELTQILTETNATLHRNAMLMERVERKLEKSL
jgi:hypothetical protein